MSACPCRADKSRYSPRSPLPSGGARNPLITANARALNTCRAFLITVFILWLAPSGAQSIVREGPLEKMRLCDAGSTTGWILNESTMNVSRDPARAGATALCWHVPIDFKDGNHKVPIGWPSARRSFPEGPARDWTAWDYLHMRIYSQTSGPAIPAEPAFLILRTPDTAEASPITLSNLKKDAWISVDIPLSNTSQWRDVRLIQFSVAESRYGDGDRLDFIIDDLSLVRYAQPAVLDLAAENTVLFSGSRYVPVRFLLLGVKPGKSAGVACELRRGDTIIGRISTRAERGPQRLALGLGNQHLEPGIYEVAVRLEGSAREAAARIRVVESPWE